MMKAILLCFLFLFLQILSLVGASSRNLDLAKAQNLKTLPLNDHTSSKGMRVKMELTEEARANKGVRVKMELIEARANKGMRVKMELIEEARANKGMRVKMELKEEARANKVINKIGSSPPSCEHKCYGCMPCEAIQVPTTTGRVRVEYTNYEPEGWKCKCGPTFYSP